jgi:hypothetical protein
LTESSTHNTVAIDLSSDPLRDKYISASRTSGYHLENYLDDEVFKFVIPLTSSEATGSALDACVLVKGDRIVGAYAERRGSSLEIGRFSNLLQFSDHGGGGLAILIRPVTI